MKIRVHYNGISRDLEGSLEDIFKEITELSIVFGQVGVEILHE